MVYWSSIQKKLPLDVFNFPGHQDSYPDVEPQPSPSQLCPLPRGYQSSRTSQHRDRRHLPNNEIPNKQKKEHKDGDLPAPPPPYHESPSRLTARDLFPPS